MVSKQTILNNLPPYKNKDVLLSKYQTIGDIKKNIIKQFESDKKDYRKIYKFFLSNDEYATCKKIWDFLRVNVPNVTEDYNLQTLRTPAALLTTADDMGADCKNYALFTAGVLNAINESGVMCIPFAFRFCKYLNGNDISHHVFIVAFPEDPSIDIWIDAIADVPYFDYRREPDYYKDKFINSNNMSLIKMSGMGDLGQQAASAAEDAFLPGSGEVLNALGINAVFSKAGVSSSFFSMFPFLDFLDNSTHQWKSRVSKLKNRTANEILSWYYELINSGGGDVVDAGQFQAQWGTLPDSDKVRDITPQLDYTLAYRYNKLLDDKIYHGADTVAGDPLKRSQAMINLNNVNQSTKLPVSSSASANNINNNNTNTSTAGMSGIVIAGLVAAGIYMFIKKR